MKNIFRISGVILFVLSIFLIHSCKKDKPTPPIITTTAASAITQTTATSGGNITSDGGAAITVRGVCWSTTTGLTTALSTKTTDGTGTGIFTSSITALTAGTVYYVKAYATNSAGTAYGNEISFTSTASTVPVLTTTAESAITQTTATSGGNITSDGGATVTAHGVCWSTTTGPTTALSTKTTDNTGTGIFTSSITALTAGTVYYVKAYATNSAGTAYGNEISFTTNPATTPVLTTTSVTTITQNTANAGGIITSDGAATIIERGICWSTTPSPTTANNKTSEGSGIGSFTCTITGLSSNTVYYVRAYAYNSIGIAYGNQVSFKTITIPTLITTEVSLIAGTIATSGGNITSDGGSSVTFRGVCWSTSANPTISNSTTTDGTGAGTFMSSLTDLLLGTKYYVRAYAINNAGTAYANEINFTTSTTLTIGDSFQGGKIAYILQPSDQGYDANVLHGLIAAPSDQSVGIEWGCYGTAISGADDAAIGTGNQNTIQIINDCSIGSYAARLCYDLELNGYSDWYLPSIDELMKLYYSHSLIGGFTTADYWSSTEISSTNAWSLFFYYGWKSNYPKTNKMYVRAIRSF